MTSQDKNVEAIRQKLLDRSQVGLSKYGVTTERTDIDFVGWLDHMQQEMMDGAIYAQAAMVAHADTATLEQEIKQVRSRLARVEGEHANLLAALNAAASKLNAATQCHPNALPYLLSDALDLCNAAIAKVQP